MNVLSYGKDIWQAMSSTFEGMSITFSHLMRRPMLAEFPDTVTKRGAKHLVELSDMVADGARAVMLFLIQIGSARSSSRSRTSPPSAGCSDRQPGRPAR